jgi:hypothetical protein
MRTNLSTIFLVALYSLSLQADTVFFGGASWKVTGIHWPGIITDKESGQQFPLPRRKENPGTLNVSENMDQMVVKSSGSSMVFKRACKDDVVESKYPNVDFSQLERSLTVWTHESCQMGGCFHSLVYEQAEEGLLVGGHHSENKDAIIKTTFTIKPSQVLPKPPIANSDSEERIPTVPRELGIKSVAKYLATKFGMLPQELIPYLSTSVSRGKALQVDIWMDKDKRALLNEREVTDPCDPRWGNVKAAKYLYVFNMHKLQDPEGHYYVIQTKLIEVATGKILNAYMPSTTDTTDNIDKEIANSYDNLKVRIKAPTLSN